MQCVQMNTLEYTFIETTSQCTSSVHWNYTAAVLRIPYGPGFLNMLSVGRPRLVAWARDILLF